MRKPSPAVSPAVNVNNESPKIAPPAIEPSPAIMAIAQSLKVACARAVIAIDDRSAIRGYLLTVCVMEKAPTAFLAIIDALKGRSCVKPSRAEIRTVTAAYFAINESFEGLPESCADAVAELSRAMS